MKKNEKKIEKYCQKNVKSKNKKNKKIQKFL